MRICRWHLLSRGGDFSMKTDSGLEIDACDSWPVRQPAFRHADNATLLIRHFTSGC